MTKKKEKKEKKIVAKLAKKKGHRQKKLKKIFKKIDKKDFSLIILKQKLLFTKSEMISFNLKSPKGIAFRDEEKPLIDLPPVFGNDITNPTKKQHETKKYVKNTSLNDSKNKIEIKIIGHEKNIMFPKQEFKESQKNGEKTTSFIIPRSFITTIINDDSKTIIKERMENNHVHEIKGDSNKKLINSQNKHLDEEDGSNVIITKENIIQNKDKNNNEYKNTETNVGDKILQQSKNCLGKEVNKSALASNKINDDFENETIDNINCNNNNSDNRIVKNDNSLKKNIKNINNVGQKDNAEYLKNDNSDNNNSKNESFYNLSNDNKVENDNKVKVEKSLITQRLKQSKENIKSISSIKSETDNDYESFYDSNTLNEKGEESILLNEDEISEIKSIGREQAKRNNVGKDIIIRKITNKTEETYISLELVIDLLRNGNIEKLQKYSFPYMSQSQFNYNICRVESSLFTRLFFYCPKCFINLRHYSVPPHIFQYHFTSIDEYLNNRDICFCCSKLMSNEFQKIKTSLEFFINLAVIFTNTNSKGTNLWKRETNASIEYLKNLNIKEQLNKKTKDARIYLSKNLPKNNNKYKKRKYKKVINKIREDL